MVNVAAVTLSLVHGEIAMPDVWLPFQALASKPEGNAFWAPGGVLVAITKVNPKTTIVSAHILGRGDDDTFRLVGFLSIRHGAESALLTKVLARSIQTSRHALDEQLIDRLITFGRQSIRVARLDSVTRYPTA